MLNVSERSLRNAAAVISALSVCGSVERPVDGLWIFGGWPIAMSHLLRFR